MPFLRFFKKYGADSFSIFSSSTILVFHSFFIVALVDLTLVAEVLVFAFVLLQSFFLRSFLWFWINFLVSLSLVSVFVRVSAVFFPKEKLSYQLLIIVLCVTSIILTFIIHSNSQATKPAYVRKQGLAEVFMLVAIFASIRFSIGSPSGSEVAALLVGEDNAVWNSVASRSLAQALDLKSLSSVGYGQIPGPLILTSLGTTAPLTDINDPDHIDIILRTTLNLWIFLIFGVSLFIGSLTQALIASCKSTLIRCLSVSAIGSFVPILLFGIFFEWASLSLLVGILFLLASFVFVLLCETNPTFKTVKYSVLLALLIGASLSWWPMFVIALPVGTLFLSMQTGLQIYTRRMIVSMLIAIPCFILLRAGSIRQTVITAKESFLMVSPQNPTSIITGCLVVFTSLFLIRVNSSRLISPRFMSFYLNSILVMSLIWLALDLTSKFFVGDSSYGSKKVFQIVLVSSLPMMFLLGTHLSKKIKSFEFTVCLLLVCGLGVNISILFNSFSIGKDLLRKEKQVEQKSIQLLYDAQKKAPGFHILCHSGPGIDEASNYLNERSAYICSRHSSGFTTSVDPYLISTWAIAQTRRTLSIEDQGAESPGQLFLKLLEDEEATEKFSILDLTGPRDPLPLDTSPGTAWILDLDLNRFPITRAGFSSNNSLATWLLLRE